MLCWIDPTLRLARVVLEKAPLCCDERKEYLGAVREVAGNVVLFYQCERCKTVRLIQQSI